MSTCPVTTTKRSSKCCEIPELPPCPPCPPANNSKDCKDEKKNKCPPMPTTDCSDCKPKWIECSPNATKMYPVPQGVQILPISVGGRNPTGGSCGKCGQDKPAGKPKVSANCPMMKPKCPGLAKAEDNSPGLFAKLASLFGKDKEHETETMTDADRLEKVCQSLNVEDDRIRHHRNVFNPELVVRRDGYMCPLIKKEGAESSLSEKFIAQCEGDCSCPPPEDDCDEEGILEEGDDDDCEELLEEDDDDECAEDGEGECILEEEQPAPSKCNYEEFNKLPSSCCDECRQKGATCCTPMSNFVIRVQTPFSEGGGSESCETILDKLCKSRAPMYPDPPKDMPPNQDSNNNLKVVEIKEEAVTCVCTPTPPNTADTTSSTSPSDSKTKCESTKSPEEARKLPPPPCPPVSSPKPKPEIRKIDPPELAPPENMTKNTCINCGKTKCDCNQELKDHLKDCAGLGTLPAISPLVQKSEEIPPACEQESKTKISSSKKDGDVASKEPWNYEAKPLFWDKGNRRGSGCSSKKETENPQKTCETEEKVSECQAPPSPITKAECPPAKNDCETLSATEMCRANLASLMCGCPTVPPRSHEGGQGEEREPSVWNPPPPPPCAYCGAERRGDNEDCALCTFTRRARDPYRYDWVCPSNIQYSPSDNPWFSKEPEQPKCESDEFEMTPQGTPVYEGGMCLSRAKYFLWKTNPLGNMLKRVGFESECYNGFRRCFKGAEEESCVCEAHHKYKGGMSQQEYRQFIWKNSFPTRTNKEEAQ